MIILMVTWVEFAPENIGHKISFFREETVCGVTWQNICMVDFFVMFSQGVSREQSLEQLCAVSPGKTDCEVGS